MPTTIETGWLKDKEGNKFAPKTLTSQVQTSDGTLIEDKIQADLDAAKEEIFANVTVPVDKVFIAEYSVTTALEIQNAVGEGKAVFCKYTTEDTTAPYLLAPLTETTSIADTFSIIDNRGRQWIFALVKSTNNWTMQKDQVVKESGGDMTGTLTLSSDPTENLHAATKQYVDNATANIDLSTKVSKSGDTMTGPIEFSGTSNAIDFDTSGWIRGKTTAGGRYDIFGYFNPTTLQVGGTYPALSLKGKNTRPTYNDAEMALLSDVESNIFIAEYGVTTAEELQAAVSAGKQLICKYSSVNGLVHYATGYPVSSTMYVFTEVRYDQIITINYAVNRWLDIQTKFVPLTDDANKLQDTLIAQSNTNYTTKQVRNIILVADGEEIPAGANGDICLVYAP